jgi:hypothetical protein
MFDLNLVQNDFIYQTAYTISYIGGYVIHLA